LFCVFRTRLPDIDCPPAPPAPDAGVAPTPGAAVPNDQPLDPVSPRVAPGTDTGPVASLRLPRTSPSPITPLLRTRESGAGSSRTWLLGAVAPTGTIDLRNKITRVANHLGNYSLEAPTAVARNSTAVIRCSGAWPRAASRPRRPRNITRILVPRQAKRAPDFEVQEARNRCATRHGIEPLRFASAVPKLGELSPWERKSAQVYSAYTADNERAR
jgi:hypothetical protein